MDRLGRDYEEMIRQLDIITREKEVAIIILDMPLIDTRRKQGDDLTGKFISNVVIQRFSYVAHMERSMNHQRTMMEGLAVVRERGVRFVRRPLKSRKATREYVGSGRTAKYQSAKPHSTWAYRARQFISGRMSKRM